MSQLVVGLTGGIASGKTSVSDTFAALGIDVIDADVVARMVVKKGSAGLQAIVEQFGTSILNASGELDRAQLRKLVFSDSAKQAWLNNLLHPLIRAEMQQQVEQASSSYCILSVPLLVENSMTSMVDRVLVVDTDESKQLTRAIQRDGSDEQTIRNIMQAQASRQQRLDVADDVIQNDRDTAHLQEQVHSLHKNYLNIAGKNL